MGYNEKKHVKSIVAVSVFLVIVLAYIGYMLYLIWIMLMYNYAFSESDTNEVLWKLTRLTNRSFPRTPLLDSRDWSILSKKWSLQNSKSGVQWLSQWDVRTIEEGLRTGKRKICTENAEIFRNQFTPGSLTSYCSDRRYLECLAKVPNVYLWKDFLFYYQNNDELDMFLQILSSQRFPPAQNPLWSSQITKQVNQFFSYLGFLLNHPKDPLKNVSAETKSFIQMCIPPQCRNLVVKQIDDMERTLAHLATFASSYLPIPLVHLIGEYVNHHGMPILSRPFA
jgi:hypothetical protein